VNSTALLLGAFARLGIATILASFVFLAVRTPCRSLVARLGVWAAAAAFAALALALVLSAIPYPRSVGLFSADVVASATFIAGFAVESLIGEEVRRLFR
jgi:hypothetical protein